MLDDRVHHHIKYGGGQRVALRHTSLPFERHAVIPPRSGQHGQVAPVGPQHPPGVRADNVALQDLQAPGPVQSVITLFSLW